MPCRHRSSTAPIEGSIASMLSLSFCDAFPFPRILPLIALSIVSSAIRLYVVHFPPTIVRSPEGERVILCLLETSFVEAGLSGSAARGRNPAKMQSTSSRSRRLCKIFPGSSQYKIDLLIKSYRFQPYCIKRSICCADNYFPYHGIAKSTLPSSVFGIIIAESLLRKDLVKNNMYSLTWSYSWF